jgi:hypothetical protein
MTSINGTVKPTTINTTLTPAQEQMVAAKPGKDLGKSVADAARRISDVFVTARANTAMNNTQAGQLHQVADGMRKGTISTKEAEGLLKSQQEFTAKARSAMADGKLSAKEQIELQVVQQNLQAQITAAAQGAGGSLGSIFTGLDKNNGRQAAQLDKLADGIAQGTVTRSEASSLLGQQVGIADARGDADSAKESTAVTSQLDRADKTLENYSKPGNQLSKIAIAVGRIAVPVKG